MWKFRQLGGFHWLPASSAASQMTNGAIAYALNKVPLMNFVRPYEIAMEIWSASVPAVDRPRRYRFVTFWWSCFVSSSMLTCVFRSTRSRNPKVRGQRSGHEVTCPQVESERSDEDGQVVVSG